MEEKILKEQIKALSQIITFGNSLSVFPYGENFLQFVFEAFNSVKSINATLVCIGSHQKSVGDLIDKRCEGCQFFKDPQKQSCLLVEEENLKIISIGTFQESYGTIAFSVTSDFSEIIYTSLHSFANSIAKSIENHFQKIKLDQKNYELTLYRNNLEKLVDEKTQKLLKQNEEYLLLNKEFEIQANKFQKAQELGKIGHWELDIASGKLTWSDQIYEIFKLPSDKFEATYDNFLTIVHPDDREKVDRAYLSSLKTRKPYKIDHRVLFPDGSIGFVTENCETTYDENGAPLVSIGTVLDITERKEAELKNEIINVIASKLNSDISLRDFCWGIYLELQKIKAFTDIYVTNFDREKDKITVVFQVENGEINNGSPEIRIGGNGLIEYIIKTKEGIVLNENDFPLFIRKHKLNLYGEKYNSWIGVPLLSEGKAVGILAARSFSEDCIFSKSDLETLSLIGTQVGSFVERQRTLKEIKKFEKYFSISTNILCVTTFKSELLIVNPKFSEVTGYSQEESFLKSILDFVHPDDLDNTLYDVSKVLEGGNVSEFKARFKCKNGDYKWFMWGAIADKEMRQVFASAKDISEQIEKEQKIKEQNEKIILLNKEFLSQNIELKNNQKTLLLRNSKILNYQKALLDISNIQQVDLQLTLREIIKKAAKTLEVSRVSLWKFQNKFSEIKCEVSYDSNKKLFGNGVVLNYKDCPTYFKALKTNKPIIIHDAKNNEITKEIVEDYLIPFDITSLVMISVQIDGAKTGVLFFEQTEEKRIWKIDETLFCAGVSNVISLAIESAEKKEAELKIIESDNKLHSLFNHAVVGIAFVSLNSVILKVNATFCEMLEYSEEELLSMTPADFTHPDDIQATINYNTQVIKGEIPNYITIKRYITKSGNTVWAELSSTFVSDADGKILYGFGIIKNITKEVELKKEKELRDTRISVMFNEAPLGLAINDSLNGTMYEVNDHFAEILHTTKEELKNVDWKTITHPDDIKPGLELMKELNAEKIEKFSLAKRFILPDHSLAHTIITVKSLGVDSNGRRIHLTMIEDVTDRKKAEDTIQKQYLALKENQEVLLNRNNKLLKHKKILLELLSTNNEDDLGEKINEIVKSASIAINMDRISYWGINKSVTKIECKTFHCKKGVSFEKGLTLKKSEFPVYFKAIKKGHSIMAHDVRVNKEVEELSKNHLAFLDIKSKFDIIIRVKKKSVGIISFECVKNNKKWLEEDEQFMLFIANIITLAIESSERKEAEKLLEIERKHILRAHFEGEEQEKNRISAELHDGLGQILSAVKFSLAALGNEKDLRKTTIEKIKNIKDIVSEANIETSRISKNLLPRILEDYGLVIAVEKILIDIQNNLNIKTIFTVNPTFELFDDKTRIVYRIIQESINNAIKHSETTVLEVVFDEKDNRNEISIIDNGKGFDTSIISTGFGLENLKRRALSIDAKLEISSIAGKGTKVVLTYIK
ncbi:MAG: PAS domain S-box protein [Cyclobacteriaceae bacterium]|nr:PAS domain S-box protein [Cyclobacteriaceae bacterium]